MWNIKYVVYWITYKALWVLPKNKRAELRLRLDLAYGIKTQPIYQRPTPTELRDKQIAAWESSIKRNLQKQLEKLKNDKNFILFLEKTSMKKDVGIQQVEEFYNQIASQYAKMFFLFDNVCSVQYHEKFMNNQNGENEETMPVFNLCITKHTTDNTLSLEVLSQNLKLKKVNYPFLDFSKFFHMSHIIDVNKAIVHTSYMHYAWELFTQFFQTSSILTGKDANSVLGCGEKGIPEVGLNIIANTIARNSRRGAGNVVIVSNKDLEDLKYSLWEQKFRMISDASQVKSYDEIFEIEEHLFDIPDFEQLDFLKYEFTFQNIRFFSSSMMDSIKTKLLEENEAENEAENINLIMLYNGIRNDSALTMGIGEICNWVKWKKIDGDEALKYYTDSVRGSFEENQTLQLYKVRDTFAVDIIAGDAPSIPISTKAMLAYIPLSKKTDIKELIKENPKDNTRNQ